MTPMQTLERFRHREVAQKYDHDRDYVSDHPQLESYLLPILLNLLQVQAE